MLTGIVAVAVSKRQKAAIEQPLLPVPLPPSHAHYPCPPAPPFPTFASIAGSYFYAACQCVTKTGTTYLYTHVCVCVTSVCVCVYCVFILHDHVYDC